MVKPLEPWVRLRVPSSVGTGPTCRAWDHRRLRLLGDHPFLPKEKLGTADPDVPEKAWLYRLGRGGTYPRLGTLSPGTVRKWKRARILPELRMLCHSKNRNGSGTLKFSQRVDDLN